MSEIWLRREYQSWVGALSEGQESNWNICVDRALWGTGSNAGGSVKAGDEFFVWRSGRNGGWFARCIVTSDARRPSITDPAPWDDGRDYKWIFGIRPIKQLEDVFNPGSEANVQNITGIPNIRLGQFPRLSADESHAVRSFFGIANPPKTVEDVIEEELDAAHERVLKLRKLAGPVEVLQLVNARRGQGVFRSNLETIENQCRVTGLRSVRHLRASHIKPWRVSDDLEKVDGHNGLLLSPHVDHLFDRGWIMFTNEGQMVASSALEPEVFSSWRIEPPRDPRPFLAKQVEYLEYHRDFVFKS